MHSVASSRLRRQKGRLASFTLVELLTVIAIIAILAGLTLAAASKVMNSANRNRATVEIAAMSSALEAYKNDNGVYPVGYPMFNSTTSTSSSLTGPPSGSYTLDPSVAGGTYQSGAQALYEALTSKTNFLDTPVAGARVYMPTFKANQIGNATTAAGTGYGASTASYVQDPWSYAYGYSTGDGNSPQTLYPNNAGTTNSTPGSSFDLWSTGGTTGNTTSNPNATNTWLKNW